MLLAASCFATSRMTVRSLAQTTARTCICRWTCRLQTCLRVLAHLWRAGAGNLQPGTLTPLVQFHTLQLSLAVAHTRDAASRASPSRLLLVRHQQIQAYTHLDQCYPRTGCPGHEPFFDSECRQLEQQLKSAPVCHQQQLERGHHALIRAKRPYYSRQRLAHLLDSGSLHSRYFWNLRAPNGSTPSALQNIQA